jgi:hypothetical protein
MTPDEEMIRARHWNAHAPDLAVSLCLLMSALFDPSDPIAKVIGTLTGKGIARTRAVEMYAMWKRGVAP